MRDYRDYRIYAYAASIISTVLDKDFKYVAEDFNIRSFEIEYAMMVLLANRFNDVNAAYEIAEEFRTFGYEDDVTLGVKSLKKALEVKKLVVDTLINYYNKKATSGINSLTIYSALATIERQPIVDSAECILSYFDHIDEYIC